MMGKQLGTAKSQKNISKLHKGRKNWTLLDEC
jgi:hypothetical protein